VHFHQPNNTSKGNICLLDDQLKTPLASFLLRIYSIISQDSRLPYVLAMASEFKLSATLRGHEEDVCILSCDFTILKLEDLVSFA
jgi:hypothetical protein